MNTEGNQPAQKAKELIEKFKQHAYPPMDDDDSEEFYEAETRIAKACAIICVDEIIDVIRAEIGIDDPTIPFWQSVKEHIQKT